MPIRTHERSQNDLSFHLNILENKEQIKLKVKVRVEVKYIQNRKIEKKQTNNETKNEFFENVSKIDKPLAILSRKKRGNDSPVSGMK